MHMLARFWHHRTPECRKAACQIEAAIPYKMDPPSNVPASSGPPGLQLLEDRPDVLGNSLVVAQRLPVPPTAQSPARVLSPGAAQTLKLSMPSNQASFFLKKLRETGQTSNRLLDFVGVLLNRLDVKCIPR